MERNWRGGKRREERRKGEKERGGEDRWGKENGIGIEGKWKMTPVATEGIGTSVDSHGDENTDKIWRECKGKDRNVWFCWECRSRCELVVQWAWSHQEAQLVRDSSQPLEVLFLAARLALQLPHSARQVFPLVKEPLWHHAVALLFDLQLQTQLL